MRRHSCYYFVQSLLILGIIANRENAVIYFSRRGRISYIGVRFYATLYCQITIYGGLKGAESIKKDFRVSTTVKSATEAVLLGFY